MELIDQNDGIPTVADYFQVVPTSTPRPQGTPQTPNESAFSETIELSDYQVITIYDNSLDPNWQVINTDNIDYELDSSDYYRSRDRSIKISSQTGSGTVYFVVSPDTQEEYPYHQVIGLEFWINSGNSEIATDEVSVTILGSNDYVYYVDGDDSVTNEYDPIFSETRLYYLDINRTIPSDTWVKIEVRLDDLIYDPIYENVTGFYIKTSEDVIQEFFIDDIQLIMIDETAEEQEMEEILDQSNDSSSDLVQQDESGTEVEEGFNPLVKVSIDAGKETHEINPMIYGLSSASDEFLEDLKPGSNSWGGNPSTRYNWELGNAWNIGRDFFYRNTNFGSPPGSASAKFIESATEAGVKVRLAVPTLGWVAKNDVLETCSFPQPDGGCGNAELASCIDPGVIADPELANVESDVASIRKWILEMVQENGYEIQVIAMDNEPELWGVTHYDVHPECTTYQEILDKYIEYASAIRSVAPNIELAGPVTCCWYYYWDSPAGFLDKVKHGNRDFLPWFLEKVQSYDTSNSIQTIDVLDIHYYPDGLYSQEVDPETSAHRLRATRSLWDPEYVDESWINEPVFLIPRMKTIIEEYYPGLGLGISEWNYGADEHMNGALAIADVLGIFGREEVYYANYWNYPPENSPGYFAFKMYTNYDGEGAKFGDMSVLTESGEPDLLGAYSSLDEETGNLHIMLLNKDPLHGIDVQLDLSGFGVPATTTLYRFSDEDLQEIVVEEVDWSIYDGEFELPPYSISHYVLQQ